MNINMNPNEASEKEDHEDNLKISDEEAEDNKP